MTLQQLRNLYTLSLTGNMRRAAEQLFITEPALSTSLSRLEAKLGLPLLAKKGRTVQLTDAARALVVHAERILKETEEAERHMRRLAEDSETQIRFGYVAPLSQRYLPEHMRAFLDRPGNRRLMFESESGTTRNLVRLLRQGNYDFILCSDPGEDVDLGKTELFRQEILLISPADKPVAVKTLSALSKLSFIGYPRNGAMDGWLTEFQGREGVQLSFISRAPDETAIAALVERHFGCALVVAVDSLQGLPVARASLPGGNFYRSIYLVTLKSQKLTGAAGRFAAFLKQRSHAQS